jgi:hypothetical protein
MYKVIAIIQGKKWTYMFSIAVRIFLKKSVVNMGIKLYNKVPDNIKNLENYNKLKKEFRSFLLKHAFYSVDEFISSGC